MSHYKNAVLFLHELSWNVYTCVCEVIILTKKKKKRRFQSLR